MSEPTPPAPPSAASFSPRVVCRRVVVRGAVQGVFFRDTCRRVAYAHGVSGWVRNLPDGAVEAVFEGAPESVAALLEWARRGPSDAHVESMDTYPETPHGLTGFDIRPTPWRHPPHPTA